MRRLNVHRNLFGLFATCSCVLSACSGWPGSRELTATQVADVLWLPESASLEKDTMRPKYIINGRSVYVDGSGAIFFTVSDCDSIARAVIDHFARPTWRQRSTRELSPATPIPFARECRTATGGGGIIQLDAKGQLIPPMTVVSWFGEWETERGDIVTYDLTGSQQQINGFASYVPRRGVEERRRRINAERALDEGQRHR